MKAVDNILIRAPLPVDGKGMWRLAQACETLDRYASYLYVLLCDRFSETCALAERQGELVGFVTAFRLPKQPDRLFVWQVAVASSAREAGVALRMFEHIVSRSRDLRWVEATVCESNTPSLRLFHKLARQLGAPLERTQGYDAQLFAARHEAEPLVRIGPIERSA